MAAAGGAWNASVVAEYLVVRGQAYRTGGLGAIIRVASDTANYPLLAAGVTVMTFIVVLLNRTFWLRVAEIAQTRYRMD